jgi:EmrB/QacA subfamily drug resistance transporter
MEPTSWRGRPGLVLAICCMSLLLVSLDVTIVNIALPAIRTNLHASLSGLQWTIDAYTLVLATLLMLSGSLGDRLGRRRVFQTGLLLFTAGSLLCSIAPGLGWLVAFRVVQAIGGSMLNPIAMAIIVNTFHDPRRRAAAIGVWSAVVGVSMALGPVVGGILVDTIGWRSIFWINVPVGLAAFVLTGLFVPESRAARARALDPYGQLLVIVALGSLTYAIIEAPDHGWTSPAILGLFALTAAAVTALITVELRRREPLLDIRFFGSAPFAGATMIAVAAFSMLGVFLFLNTLYLQEVRGFSPVHAGLLTLPMAAMAAVFGPICGRIVAARGTRLPLVLSGVAIIAGSSLLVPVSAHTPIPQLLAAYTLIGVGFGLVNTPITNTATSGMPRAQAGVAAAVASTSRQIGSTLGVAVAGCVVAGATATQFSAASRPAWGLLVGCGLVILGIGTLSTGRWAAGTAVRARERLEEREVAERELAAA